jgi:serine/threonine protein kinase
MGILPDEGLMGSQDPEEPVSPITPTAPLIAPLASSKRFVRRVHGAAPATLKAGVKVGTKAAPKSDAKSDAKSDEKADAKVGEKSDAKADERSDAKADAFSNENSDASSDVTATTVDELRQVTCVQYTDDGREKRRAFEVMSVSIVNDGRNPLRKRLHMVDTRGRTKTVPLMGARAWLVSVPSHDEDVQPSFAQNSVCIRSRDTYVGWLVAFPGAEDQRGFLDRLCGVGCLLRDLPEHMAFLPQARNPAEAIRLGRPTSSRTRAKEDIVALKVATADDKISQLIDEFEVLMNLHHEGIVGAYGIYEVKVNEKRSLGMVLDFMNCMDLSCWIPTDGFPEDMGRAIMAPICSALVYIHEIPVVHRDLKPSNILCKREADGSAKFVLADFGLATHIMDRKISTRCGTGGFVAPEMFREDWPTQVEEETVTNIAKIDMFSFGMVAYTSLTGSNPFSAANLDATYRRNARGLLSSTSTTGLSHELQSLLSGLCAKHPRERWSSSEAAAHPWFSADCRGSSSSDGLQKAKVTWAEFERTAYAQSDSSEL